VGKGAYKEIYPLGLSITEAELTQEHVDNFQKLNPWP